MQFVEENCEEQNISEEFYGTNSNYSKEFDNERKENKDNNGIK